jgi:hypothetical protein
VAKRQRPPVTKESITILYDYYKSNGFILTLPYIGKGITDEEIELMNKTKRK